MSTGALSPGAGMPIAIVGIGCRFPGGVVDTASFWRLLADGVDAIREIPPDRFDVSAFRDAMPGTPGRIATRLGGFVDQPIEAFDASFFGISRAYAERLDPQQRLLLETAWEAMEDAGLDVVGLQGSPTGVFVGQWVSDFEHRLFADPRAITFPMTMGSGRYAAAGRLSFAFGFRGPSLSIDAACSSGLAAVHLAVRSLRSGDSAIALAGGVNMILAPHIHVAYSSSNMLAPDGRCRFGDERGSGYVRAEGAGVVVLKPLAAALAARDRVYAVIRGSAVNNDGDSSGVIGRPSRIGQEELIRRALRDGGVAATQLGYVEAHGTGTRAGDPVELAALGAVLCDGRAAGASRTWVGSVKTNFGHTEAAAGIAGLIKTALMLERGVIAPSLHFTTPNPEVAWSTLPLAIPTALTQWPEHDGERFAGVSSYGIGGTNAHVIVASMESNGLGALPTVPEGTPAILPFSAKSPAALRALATRYADRLADPTVSVPALCWSAATRRSALAYRAAFVATDRAALVASLRAFADGAAAAADGVVHDATNRRLAFVVPGQGAQWHGMVRQFFAQEPVFRDALQRCDDAAQHVVPWSIVSQLHLAPDAPGYIGDRIDVIQPTLVAVAVAYAAWLESRGIVPDAVVGHSLGEVAAAAIAGVLDVDTAMRLICVRSALMQRVSGQGAMAVVELSASETQASLVGHESTVSVAVNNAPRSTVISGDADVVQSLVAAFERNGIFARRITVDVASHSPQMAPLVPDLVGALSGLRSTNARVPLYSTVTGQRADGADFDAEYWGRNLGQPVQFDGAIASMIADDVSAFLELGPHPILSYAVSQTADAVQREVVTAACGKRDTPDVPTAMGAIASLWANGVGVDWHRVMPWGGRVESLPLYPWQRERFWYADASAGAAPAVAPREHGLRDRRLLGVRVDTAAANGGIEWDVRCASDGAQWLRDHVVSGSAIFPAAAAIDSMAAAVRDVFGEAGSVLLRDVTFEAAAPMRAEGVALRVVAAWLTPDRLALQLRVNEDDGWRVVARAGGSLVGRDESPAVVDPAVLTDDIPHDVDPVAHYQAMRRRKLSYGPAFQVVSSIARRESVATAALVAVEHDPVPQRVTLMDGALQVLLSLVPPSFATECETIVPVAIDRVVIHAEDEYGRWPSTVLVTASRESADDTGRLTGRLMIRDDSGRDVVHATGVQMQVVRGVPADDLPSLRHRLAWTPVTIDRESVSPDRRYLLVCDRGGLLARTAQRLRALGHEVVEWQVEDALGGAVLPEGVHRIVIGTPLDATSVPSHDVADAIDRALVTTYDVPLALLQRVVASAHAPDAVVIVTSGAVSVHESAEVTSPLQGAAWGLARVVRHEHPSIGCVVVDLVGYELADTLADGLARGTEAELAYRDGGWWASRVEQSPVVDGSALTSGEEVPLDGLSVRYEAEVGAPGRVETMGWHEPRSHALKPDEVEIEVSASGVNFLDVLAVLNAYPSASAARSSGTPDAALVAPRLGLECTGVVTRVGHDVRDVAVGDRVVAVGEGSLASHVVVNAALVAQLPDHVSFEQGSGFPIAFLTAARALEDVARLRRGERVLIHSAAGGVGLAALQIATACGAEIFATAGTPEKRAWLHSIGVPHVFDSRSLDWGDEILAATAGAGVDVVLNSLAGAAIETGFRVLATYGRFIEIGKRDVFGETRIGLEVFRKQAIVTSVYLLEQMRDDAERLGVRFRDLVARLGRGELQLLPTTPWSTDQLADAFRSLLPGTHIGKVVVVHDVRPATIRPAPPHMPVRANATYVITGGLGELGQRAAALLVARGAQHLLLLARSEPSPATQRAIAALRAAGATVETMAIDIATDAATHLLRAKLSTMPPLAGVLHAAGVLDDGLLTAQTPSRLRAVAAAKVTGLLHLAALPELDAADFVVSYSSVASALGTRGQSNYAAANAVVDAMAHTLRARGIRATSIGFGPFGGRGLASGGRGLSVLSDSGLGALRGLHADVALDALAGSPCAHEMVALFDAPAWLRHFGAEPERRRMSALVTSRVDAATAENASMPTASAGLHGRLGAAIGRRQRQDVILAFVQSEVAAVLRSSADRVEPRKALRSMGIDSLTALELRNRLEQATSLRLPGTLVFTYPNAAAIAAHLLERLAVAGNHAARTAVVDDDATAVAVNDDLDALASEMAALDDDAVRRLLGDPDAGAGH